MCTIPYKMVNLKKSKEIECEDLQTITYDIHTVEEGENTVKIYIA